MRAGNGQVKMMWVLFVSWVPNLRAGCLCAQTTKICTLAGEQPEKTCSRYMAQLVKNPPAMWETWVQSLGWEDPLEKGEADHSNILAWRVPWTV